MNWIPVNPNRPVSAGEFAVGRFQFPIYAHMPPFKMLGEDEMDALTRHVAPQDVGRLQRTSRAFFISATPQHPEWAVLRASVV